MKSYLLEVSKFLLLAKHASRACQLRLSYHPKVMINPTWVQTILRKFNLDLVDMGIKLKGYSYIVDI